MSAPKGRLSALEAAHQVLAEAGTPLPITELARRILESGLWESRTKTPAASIAARITEDIVSKGSASRFRRVGRQVFSLSRHAEP